MAYIIKDKAALQNTNGKALKNSDEILNPSCNCGIECCDGIIKLPISYSSTAGVQGPVYGYVLDGEFVFGDEQTVRTAVKNLKNFVPTPTPSSTPSVTPSSTPTPTPTTSGT